MTWIFLVMLAMIVGSIIVELILPMRIKQALGTAICWGLMTVTMTCLALAAVGLVFVTWTNWIAPLLT